MPIKNIVNAILFNDVDVHISRQNVGMAIRMMHVAKKVLQEGFNI